MLKHARKVWGNDLFNNKIHFLVYVFTLKFYFIYSQLEIELSH